MHSNDSTSPVTVVPLKVAVVAVLAVCRNRLAVVWLLDEHDHPVMADAPVAPAMVTVTVHAPVVPDVMVPTDAPPAVALIEHPDVVNLVPAT